MEDLERRLAVARGDMPADLVVRGGRVLSVFTREWLDVDIAVCDGWVAGLGYAYAFTDRLSGKLEYLHFDLGNVSYNVNLISGSADFTTMTATTRVSGDIFRVGLDYKFSP